MKKAKRARGPFLMAAITDDGVLSGYAVNGPVGDGIRELLGGYMEVVLIPGLTIDPMNSLIGLVDEDGLSKQLPLNPVSLLMRQNIVGPMVITRARPDGEFVSLTAADYESIAAWVVRQDPWGLAAVRMEVNGEADICLNCGWASGLPPAANCEIQWCARCAEMHPEIHDAVVREYRRAQAREMEN